MKRYVVHGKSYSVMLYIFRLLGFPVGVKILDLTYGVGRFYRLIKSVYKPFIIGVDIARHKWEVEPNVFIQKDCTKLTIDEVRRYGDINIVVVDPPWNHVKRGGTSEMISVSKMPYHIPNVNPWQIVYAALRLAKELNTPLIVRFMEPIPSADIILENNVVVLGSRGTVYYSIVLNGYKPSTLDRYL